MGGIFYKQIEINTSNPSSPGVGDLWIKPIASTSYEFYIYIDTWYLIKSGGTYNADLDLEDHRINVIVQETQPTIAKPGWIWVKESTTEAFFITGDSDLPLYQIV